MKSRIFLLLTVLSLMLGASVALAQETEEDDTPPEANTGFVATVSGESLEGGTGDPDAETLYIRYHVCSLNPGADVSCDETLEGFNPDTFDEWTEIEVQPNEEGEFNHGSFVSAFAREFEGGPGKGCVLRFIAQSNWGKDGFEAGGDDVLIEAQTFCAFNKTTGDVEGEEDEDEGNGRPPWAGKGKPPWAGGDEVESEGDRGGRPSWAGTPGGPKNATP